MSHPIPGQHLAERADIDPAQIRRDVQEYTDQVDDLDADDLSVLDAQAELLERAHDVLTTTLERLDRV